jgi:hypothetical protein
MTMKTIAFNNLDCVELANGAISLLVTQSVGPRVISLSLKDGENLLAQLPDTTIETPGREPFRFYGGHRLWVAPEWPESTYLPDDDPVEITPISGGISILQRTEPSTGIQKQLQITLPGEGAVISLVHTLTNLGTKTVECAPWAITQLRTGGVAILPQFVGLAENQFLPNRQLALWPYSDVRSQHVTWGNQFIFIQAELRSGAFKVGFPNPRGWLAYWWQGTLFVKKAIFERQAKYLDFDSSSECYCDHRFIELETLGGVSTLSPGESVSHTEIWEIHRDVDFNLSEVSASQIVTELGLETE